MKKKLIPEPVKRSSLRKAAGRKAYTFARYLNWWFSGKRFAKIKKVASLPHVWIKHQSILLRPLKDVEMWLQHNKVENLRIAVGKINKVVIEPGETFSFWHMVGNPVKRRGFKLGMTLESGKVKPGFGGGLCQLANLIYYMTLHTPLVITERWRHGFDVFPDVNRTIPFGCGATVSYNYVDLQIYNPTGNSFQLVLWISDKDLCGEIHSDLKPEVRYEIVEKNHRIEQEFWGGYTRHNEIWRKTLEKASGNILKEELLTENHAVMMYSPLLPGKKEG